MERQLYECNAVQFSGVPPRVGKSQTAPIHLKLFNLIHECRRWVDPSGVDMVPITLTLYHRTAVEFRRHRVVCYSESNWVADRRFEVSVSDIKRLSKQGRYAKVVAGYLRSLRVPEENLPLFILKIFDVIQHALPELPIVVRIGHMTVHVADNSSITTYIKGLEKMRVASLDEAAATTPCSICTDDLAHFRGGSDSDEEDEEQMIIRLPCSHLYHQDCIVPWLERCLVCPYCRYSMPLEQPTTTNRLRWPRLLMMSTGSMLILCRLLKRA